MNTATDEEETQDSVQEQMNDAKFYIKTLKAVIKQTEKNTFEDRMDYIKALKICVDGGLLSLNGWSAWINNIEYISNLSLEELKQIYPKMKELIVAFIKLDIEITQKKLIELVISTKNAKRKTSKVNGKTTYVS